jgi:hypothetical protein
MLVSAVGAQRFTLQQRAVIGRTSNTRLRQLHAAGLEADDLAVPSEWRDEGDRAETSSGQPPYISERRLETSLMSAPSRGNGCSGLSIHHLSPLRQLIDHIMWTGGQGAKRVCLGGSLGSEPISCPSSSAESTSTTNAVARSSANGYTALMCGFSHRQTVETLPSASQFPVQVGQRGCRYCGR